MFKQAAIHYPTDIKLMKQINRDIAAFHCAVAVNYMETQQLNEKQKLQIIDSLLQDKLKNTA